MNDARSEHKRELLEAGGVWGRLRSAPGRERRRLPQVEQQAGNELVGEEMLQQCRQEQLRAGISGWSEWSRGGAGGRRVGSLVRAVSQSVGGCGQCAREEHVYDG